MSTEANCGSYRGGSMYSFDIDNRLMVNLYLSGEQIDPPIQNDCRLEINI